MNILFVGCVFTSEDEAKSVVRKSRAMAQSAASATQWALIRGLDEHNGKPVAVLNSSPVGLYPRDYPVAILRTSKWSHATGADDVSVGFINLPVLKHVSRCVNLSVCCARWARRPSVEPKVVVVYSMHSPFLAAAAIARLIDPRVRVCVIVPDLPQYMDLKERHGIVYRALKALDRVVLGYLRNTADGFVVVTAEMMGELGASGKPWVVMEGLVDPSDFECDPSGGGGAGAKKVVLYTGSLQKQYGILELLEAFDLIEGNEFELWICGAGDAEEEVRSAETRDPRIHWLGQVDRRQALVLQRKATVLVNPRGPHAEFTRYSFPSKTLEYMLSGVPVVMYRLPGIPREYEPWIQWIDGEGAQAMAEKIMDTCNLPEEQRRLLGERARRFALENKNYLAQSRLVFDFLRRITSARAN